MPLTQVRTGGLAPSAVTAEIIAVDAVTVADIPNGEITGAKLHSTVDIPDAATAHTQASGTNNTTIATTAFVQTALGTVDVGQIETDQTFSANKTLTGSKNFLMAGDISLNSGVTLEVGENAKLIIVG
tara:strand:- start:43 stop:426 length:384 start_codon:yes stop_codon:yes gene_type:complete